jgi:hypothetical protein
LEGYLPPKKTGTNSKNVSRRGTLNINDFKADLKNDKTLVDVPETGKSTSPVKKVKSSDRKDKLIGNKTSTSLKTYNN